MLTFLLVGSESFTLCWCLSPKLALGETLHWLCSGRQQECKQAPPRDLLLSFPVTSPGSLACCVPKSLDPSLCWQWWDWAGSRRALHELTNMRQKKTARNWKKGSVFPTAEEQSGKNFKTCALCLKYLQEGSFKKLKLKRFISPSKNFKAGTTSPCSPRKEPIAYQEWKRDWNVIAKTKEISNKLEIFSWSYRAQSAWSLV